MTTLPVFKPSHALSAVLPPDARQLLARAAQEARSMRDDFARERHMEAAIARVKFNHPEFFKE